MKKIAVITGASSGIGYETALHLSQKDIFIILVARNEEKLQKIEQEIKILGGQAISFPTDITKSEDFKHVIKEVLNIYGKIDILINNAGVMPLSLLSEGDILEWSNAIDLNVKSVLTGIRLVLPCMRERNEGVIINIGSTAGDEIPPYGVVYGATKHAVKAITVGLHKELAMENSRIKVVYFSPGPVTTDLIVNSNNKEIANQFNKFKVKEFSPKYIAKYIYSLIDDSNINTYSNITLYP